MHLGWLWPGLNKVFKDFVQDVISFENNSTDVQSALDVLREANPLTKIAGTKQEIKEYLEKAYGNDKRAVSIRVVKAERLFRGKGLKG